MRSMARELNWSGTVTYSAERVERPTSIEAAQSIVAAADRVHGLGTRHSFNDVADTPGVLVDMTAVPMDIEVDASAGGVDGPRVGVGGPRVGAGAVTLGAGTVTLGAGTRYGDAAPAIDRAGFALHNMGSLPHISIGGAIATSTHGSGTALGSLSTAVRAFDYIGAAGELRTVRRNDPEFAGSVIHLGLLGVLTRVTLHVEPSFSLRQDTYGEIPWSTFLAHLDEVFAAGYSVCAYTNWDGRVRETLVKTRVPVGSDGVDVPSDIIGAPHLPPTPPSDRHTDRDGSIGPWWNRLPHFPITSVPSVGSEVQSEHFVALRNAAPALNAIATLADRIQPHLHVTELRTMAADDLWLSPTQGEDVLCIAFTWKKHPEAVQALLPDLEAAIAPWGGRPHWGKMSSLDAAAVRELYPYAEAFRDLVARRDPHRKFTSAFAERIFGL